MKLTAKKLSELTDVPAANIRKWRERYRILEPQRGENGYLYYTSEDYRVLLSIGRLLATGVKLAHIMKQGRAALLARAPNSEYTSAELRTLEHVIENNFPLLSRELDETLNTHDVDFLVQKKILPLTILIGRAWKSGFLTVATEHAYTRWMMGYLSQIAIRHHRKQSIGRLFVAFPGDDHELGSMMHYVLMTVAGQGGKFSGALPVDRLFEELAQGDYEELHVSATLPRNRSDIEKFATQVHKKYPHLKVKIGGSGIKSPGVAV